jgi:hypothetical protein
MTWPRDALRVRRYLNGALEGEYQLDRNTVEGAGGLDAQWCADQNAAGNRFSIVIDDPNGDVNFVVEIDNGGAR